MIKPAADLDGKCIAEIPNLRYTSVAQNSWYPILKLTLRQLSVDFKIGYQEFFNIIKL